MELVYLETTFISYLVALPARDIVIAAHQQVTRDWWQLRRHRFQCVISPVVIDEISKGDAIEIEKRLARMALSCVDLLGICLAGSSRGHFSRLGWRRRSRWLRFRWAAVHRRRTAIRARAGRGCGNCVSGCREKWGRVNASIGQPRQQRRTTGRGWPRIF